MLKRYPEFSSSRVAFHLHPGSFDESIDYWQACDKLCDIQHHLQSLRFMTVEFPEPVP
jgi:hypothetical protein